MYLQNVCGNGNECVQYILTMHFLLTSEDKEMDLKNGAKELEVTEAGVSFERIFNHMNVTKPSLIRGKSVGEYLGELKWSVEKGRKLENFWKRGKHYQFCSKPGQKRIDLNVR